MSLFLPVIEGTSRVDRQSIHVARLVADIVRRMPGVETTIVDPADFTLPHDGKGGSASDPRYTELTQRADGFFIVVPEYNHSFPGSLKRLLDSELENYSHKAVAFAGVSAGPWGGVRALESIQPVTRYLGLSACSIDVQCTAVQKLFRADGKPTDEGEAMIPRVEKVWKELIWMAQTLKWGRENLPA